VKDADVGEALDVLDRPDVLPKKGGGEPGRGPWNLYVESVHLRLGAELGLDVWVARNDRSKTYESA
jgi:hypothetical protein